MLLSQIEVVLAVAGRDMDEARALVRGDEGRGEDRHRMVESLPAQGVSANRADERGALHGADGPVRLDPHLRPGGLEQLLLHAQPLPAGLPWFRSEARLVG